jgi:hypothetical protein
MTLDVRPSLVALFRDINRAGIWSAGGLAIASGEGGDDNDGQREELKVERERERLLLNVYGCSVER